MEGREGGSRLATGTAPQSKAPRPKRRWGESIRACARKVAGNMTLHEFESRVKGTSEPNAKRVATARGRVSSTHLLEVALFLFCVAFAAELITDGGRLIAMREAQDAVERATAAFGPAPMQAATGVLAKSSHRAALALTGESPSATGALFGRAWANAIAKLRSLLSEGPSANLNLDVVANRFGEKLIAISQEAADWLSSILPSSPELGASAIGLDTNLPMLAGMAAFAALVTLCCGGAIFMTLRFVRGTRSSGFRY